MEYSEHGGNKCVGNVGSLIYFSFKIGEREFLDRAHFGVTHAEKDMSVTPCGN